MYRPAGLPGFPVILNSQFGQWFDADFLQWNAAMSAVGLVARCQVPAVKALYVLRTGLLHDLRLIRNPGEISRHVTPGTLHRIGRVVRAAVVAIFHN